MMSEHKMLHTIFESQADKIFNPATGLHYINMIFELKFLTQKPLEVIQLLKMS